MLSSAAIGVPVRSRQNSPQDLTAPWLPTTKSVGGLVLSISAVSVSLYVPEAAVTTLTSTPVSAVYALATS